MAREGAIGVGASTLELLRAVSALSRLADRELEDLAEETSRVVVRAGAYLWRQGDPAGDAYVVSSGRLEVVLEDPAPIVARVLTRGAVVGELALLTGSSRSASVRAKRDSELLEIPRAAFLRLLDEVPTFGAGLARALGAELQQSRAVGGDATPLPVTVAIVGLGPGLPVAATVEGLERTLTGFGPTITLPFDAGQADEDSFARQVDEEERRNDKVLLVADADASAQWRDCCLRQADRVLALVDAHSVPPQSPLHPRLLGCDLVWCSPPGSGRVGPWLDALQPRAVFAVPPGPGADAPLAAIARRLAGRSIGIAFSGGGARGAAHIGVLEELFAQGIVIDRVAGCSIGALVGGALASGMDPDEMAGRWRRNLVERNPLNDYTVPAVSLIRGRKLLDGLRDLFGTRRIEELEREFICVSSDLYGSVLYTHRRGALVEAIYASMCIPGVFPPALADGRVLVDGGVLNNLPVEPLSAAGEGPVIAVNLSVQQPQRDGASSAEQRRAARSRRWASAVQAAVTGVQGTVPGLRETMMRSLLLGSIDTTELARQHADVVISPDTRGIGLLQFDSFDRAVAAGRTAAREVLADEARRRALHLS